MDKTLILFKDNLIEIYICKETEQLKKLHIVQCEQNKCLTKWTFSNLAIIKKFFSDSSGKLFGNYKWTFQGNNLCLKKINKINN
jgi:hypothetical protein